jgi:hypothetical protein
LKPNLLDILTSLLAQQKIQRGVKYPLSYLVKEISKDFENGVPQKVYRPAEVWDLKNKYHAKQ